MTPHGDGRACADCGTPLAAGALRCPACDAPLVSDAACEAARAAAAELVRRLGRSPYFKDASQLAYTLRGHIRGFLEDPSHPLSASLLRFLAVVALEGGPTGMTHLLAWVQEQALRPGAPAVAAAVDYARRRHAARLQELAAGPQARELHELRARTGPAAQAAADAAQQAAVARAVAAWKVEDLPPPSRPHSI